MNRYAFALLACVGTGCMTEGEPETTETQPPASTPDHSAADAGAPDSGTSVTPGEVPPPAPPSLQFDVVAQDLPSSTAVFSAAGHCAAVGYATHTLEWSYVYDGTRYQGNLLGACNATTGTFVVSFAVDTLARRDQSQLVLVATLRGTTASGVTTYGAPAQTVATFHAPAVTPGNMNPVGGGEENPPEMNTGGGEQNPPEMNPPDACQDPNAAPPPSMPGCSDGRMVDMRSYFFHLIGRSEGSPACDWQEVMDASGLPANPAPGERGADDAPYFGLTQQRTSGGEVRGRLFLPTDSADEYGYYIHAIDVLENVNGTMKWVWKDWIPAPPFAPRPCQ